MASILQTTNLLLDGLFVMIEFELMKALVDCLVAENSLLFHNYMRIGSCTAFGSDWEPSVVAHVGGLIAGVEEGKSAWQEESSLGYFYYAFFLVFG